MFGSGWYEIFQLTITIAIVLLHIVVCRKNIGALNSLFARQKSVKYVVSQKYRNDTIITYDCVCRKNIALIWCLSLKYRKIMRHILLVLLHDVWYNYHVRLCLSEKYRTYMVFVVKISQNYATHSSSITPRCMIQLSHTTVYVGKISHLYGVCRKNFGIVGQRG